MSSYKSDVVPLCCFSVFTSVFWAAQLLNVGRLLNVDLALFFLSLVYLFICFFVCLLGLISWLWPQSASKLSKPCVSVYSI